MNIDRCVDGSMAVPCANKANQFLIVLRRNDSSRIQLSLLLEIINNSSDLCL